MKNPIAFLKGKKVKKGWRRIKGSPFGVSKRLDGHRTPTEVHMYPDRDEHTQRPKCADLSAPTTYHPLLKKAQLSSLKLCLILFYTELSQVHNKLVKGQFLKNIVLHLKSIA